jgi:hypothetical protein
VTAIESCALQTEDKYPHALSLQCQFLNPCQTGGFEVRAKVVRLGGATANVSLELLQHKQLKAVALAVFGTLQSNTSHSPPLLSVCDKSMQPPATFHTPLYDCKASPALPHAPKLAFWEAVSHAFARTDPKSIDAWVWFKDGSGWDMNWLGTTADLLYPHPL